MKPEEMSPELIEKAKNCVTPEERQAFLKEYRIELSPEELEAINSGAGDGSGNWCPDSPTKDHEYIYTGTKKPGFILGNLWPDYLHECIYCHKLKWYWTIATDI